MRMSDWSSDVCSSDLAKNRLAKRAIAETDYAGIDEFLTGPTAIATSVDPVAAAKAVVDFAKTTDKIEIVGGAMGSQVLNADGVKALARSEEHTSELQSLMRISYAVFCLKKKNKHEQPTL